MEFEIFRTGTHTSNNGVTKSYSVSDLNSIVDSYNPHNLEAPLVLGHPKSNSPAFGWIETLRVVGDRLIAKAKDVVPEFLDAVKKGLFKKRSVSLDKDGKLRHVGFLGGSLPAVQGLADIQFSEDDVNESFEFNNENDNQSDSNDSLITDSIVSQLNSLSTQIKSLTDYFEKFSSADFNSKQQAPVNNFSVSLDPVSFQKQLDEKLSNGSLTPPMKEKLLNVIDFFNTSNYSEFDSQNFSDSLSKLLTDFINSIPNILVYSEFASKPEEQFNFSLDEFSPYELNQHSLTLHKKALSLMNKEKISYTTAINKCLYN